MMKSYVDDAGWSCSSSTDLGVKRSGVSSPALSWMIDMTMGTFQSSPEAQFPCLYNGDNTPPSQLEVVTDQLIMPIRSQRQLTQPCSGNPICSRDYKPGKCIIAPGLVRGGTRKEALC